jgi:hypothetical protein
LHPGCWTGASGYLSVVGQSEIRALLTIMEMSIWTGYIPAMNIQKYWFEVLRPMESMAQLGSRGGLLT